MSDSHDQDSRLLRNGCIIGCLGCGGLILVVVLGLTGLFFWSQRTLTPTTEEFLEAIEQERYEDAWSLMSEVWRADHALDEFRDEWIQRRERLGRRVGLRSSGLSFNFGDEGATGLTGYSATYERGEASIVFEMEREDGGWVPVSVRVDEHDVLLGNEEPQRLEEPEELQ